MLGLVKKNMLSDYIAQFNNWVFDAPQTFSGFENLAALFGYPVQIFLDFSGYSDMRSEEHTSELQSRFDLVCRLLLEKKKTNIK